MVKAVRGAVQVREDNAQTIMKAACEMIDKLINENGLKKKNIVSILFSVTEDLISMNPAAAVRKSCGYDDVPLFCVQEALCDGSMPRVIRVLLTCRGLRKNRKLIPVYIGGAEALRPDLG